MDSTKRRERACGEAAEWWEWLNAGEASRVEREEFVDWLRESHIHVAEMLRLAQLHNALSQFEAWSRIGPSGIPENGNVIPLNAGKLSTTSAATLDSARPSRVREPWRMLACASAIAVMIVTAIWILRDGNVITTERGERREVALVDGSVVQVDPETRLRIDFDSRMRQVTLERGRALFRVARNPGRPFLVYANDTVVRAVGTAFGVEREGGSVVITVSEGRVAVGSSLESSHEIPPRGKPAPREVFLAAGQQIVMERRSLHVAVRMVDSQRELAWAQGRLVFNNETVAQAIEEFNRYNHVQLHVTDSPLAQRAVSGIFDAADPESFVAFVQAATSVQVERDDTRNITLSSSH